MAQRFHRLLIPGIRYMLLLSDVCHWHTVDSTRYTRSCIICTNSIEQVASGASNIYTSIYDDVYPPWSVQKVLSWPVEHAMVSDPSGSGRVDMPTVVATGAWAKFITSYHKDESFGKIETRHLSDTWKCGSLSVFFCPSAGGWKKKKKRKEKSDSCTKCCTR